MMSRTGSRFRLAVSGYRLPPASTENRAPRTEQAFTLVELLVSVVVLGFGLVIIIQSYLASLSGLNTTQNQIEAVSLAEEKFAELELKAFENNGLFEFGAESGGESINSRIFDWRRETEEISEPEYIAEELAQVCIRIGWKERNIARDVSLGAYLPKQKLQQE